MKEYGILGILSRRIRELLKECNIDQSMLIEIRLRKGKPLILYYKHQEWMLSETEGLIKSNEIYIRNNIITAVRNDVNVNQISELLKNREDEIYIVKQEDIAESISYISNYSMYAYKDELCQGYITIEGGHRIGLAGKVVVKNGVVSGLSDIGYMNIRVAHEIKGCSNSVMKHIYNEEGRVFNTLIVSPPCCGKTTLLRDIVRNISNGYKNYMGQNVSVVDERGEIAGSYKGIASLDVGVRSDVLDGCSKKEGVLMLLRSMSPRVIALDEIGGEEDAYVIRQCVNCGCGIIATIHGWDVEEISNRSRVIHGLIEEKIFSRVIVLSKDKIGNISKIV